MSIPVGTIWAFGSFALFVTMFATGPPGQHLLTGVLLVGAILMSWRGYAMGVIKVYGDHIIAREFVRTVRLPARELIAFEAQPRRGGRGQRGVTLAAKCKDATVRFPSFFSRSNELDSSTSRVAQMVVELNAWLAGSPRP